MVCATGSDFGIAFDGDFTRSTVLRLGRQSSNDFESAHRCYFAATKDFESNLGIALNGNFRVATQQCRVAMCRFASAGTEHVTYNSGRNCIVCRIFNSDCYRRIMLHATNLPTAIDGTVHRAGIDGDICFVCHGLLTPIGVVQTFARTIDITVSECTISAHRNTCSYRTTRDSDITFTGVSCKFKGLHVSRRFICTH